jgi:hypothetical protein
MIRIHYALKSSRAAIDLASIMVGIIVIGLIGGVIAATVFAVIPWAQDNAAKQQLDSVASAESAYRGLSTSKDANLQDAVSSPTSATDPNQVVLNSTFTGSAGLAVNSLLTLNTAGQYCVVATSDGKDYHAYSKSGSSKWFYITSGKTQPTEYTADAPCVSITSSVNDTAGKPQAPGTVNTIIDPGTAAVPSAPSTGTGSTPGSGTGTTSPSTPTPTPTVIKTYTFEDGVDSWRSPTTKASVDTLSTFKHTGSKALRVYTSDTNPAYVPSAGVYPNVSSGNFTMVAGQKYRVTAWLYQTTSMNPYIQVNGAKSDIVTTNNSWVQVSLDFTAISNQDINAYVTSAGTNQYNRSFSIDDVVLSQLP